jgi:hypothetical protein
MLNVPLAFSRGEPSCECSPSACRYKAMALLIFNGVSLHVIMMGSTFMFINGVISSTALVLLQFVNVGLVLLIPWLGEKWRGGVLARPVLT